MDYRELSQIKRLSPYSNLLNNNTIGNNVISSLMLLSYCKIID